MCWMCDKYGERGLWYLNPKLYARQMYKLRESGKGPTEYGQTGLRQERPAFTVSELLRIRNDEPEKYTEALRVYNDDMRQHTAGGQAITLQEA